MNQKILGIVLAVIVVVGGVGYLVLVKKTSPTTEVPTYTGQTITPTSQPVSSITQNKSLTVTFPKTGDYLFEGQTYNITWFGSEAGSYVLYLENPKAGYILITAIKDVSSTKSFSWTVPSVLGYMAGGDSSANVAPENGYRISFSSSTSGVAKYYSPVFNIVSVPKPIGNQLAIVSPSTLPNAKVGINYSFVPSISGGCYGAVVSLTSGTLPPGLSIREGSDVGGLPTKAGTYNFSLNVDSKTIVGSDTTDVKAGTVACSRSATKSFTLTVQ